MAPKRKAQNSPKDVKLVKKGLKMKTFNTSSWKEEYNIPEKNSAGKNNNDDEEEKKICPSVKFEYFSPELLDENKNINKSECPNIQLNLLLQKKTKNNFQSSVRWKTYLFPSPPKVASICQKSYQYFGLD